MVKLTDFLMDIGKPVAYYPKLSAITGGVKETLLLCQLIYWQGKQESRNGWIYKTREELTEETGLSRYEQETARKNLIKKGFLEEKLAGIPARLHYRVNVEAVNEAWNEYIESSSLGEYSKQDEDVQDNDELVEIPPTSLRESNQLDGGKVTNRMVENLQTITENTTENTTKITTEDIVGLVSQNEDEDAFKEKREPVPYKEIVTLYHELCPSLPRVAQLTDKRKQKLRSLWRFIEGDLDKIREVFENAEDSDFLSGRNGRWTGCNFDWLINTNNFVKVLEGSYNDRARAQKKAGDDPFGIREYLRGWGDEYLLNEK